MTRGTSTAVCILVALFSSFATGQDHTEPTKTCSLEETCKLVCANRAACTFQLDERTCGRDIQILGQHIKTNDPVCEAAKSSQNAVYAAQKLNCELAKGAENEECEVRRSHCLSVAKACGEIRGRAVSGKLRAARLLWVDDNPDDNPFERQALAELTANIVTAKSIEEALTTIKVGTNNIDVIVSHLRQSDDPSVEYSLLAAHRQSAHPVPYVIFNSLSNAASIRQAKARGAFGEASQATSLFDLVSDAVSRRR